jgi:glycosyltransferase involved in cell wall biosynthesis
MQELVQDGESGLLFRPGNSGGLRRAILRLASDRKLLAKLQSGLPAVKTIEEDATHLLNLYENLLGRSPE